MSSNVRLHHDSRMCYDASSEVRKRFFNNIISPECAMLRHQWWGRDCLMASWFQNVLRCVIRGGGGIVWCHHDSRMCYDASSEVMRRLFDVIMIPELTMVYHQRQGLFQDDNKITSFFFHKWCCAITFLCMIKFFISDFSFFYTFIFFFYFSCSLKLVFQLNSDKFIHVSIFCFMSVYDKVFIHHSPNFLQSCLILQNCFSKW